MGLLSKFKFWKKEEVPVTPAMPASPEYKEEKKVVLHQKSLDIGSSLGEINQKVDRLSSVVGQCFVALDNKIDSHKDNIITIEEGISKQIGQHEDFKSQLESYESKILRLVRSLRYEIETEIETTKDEATKGRLSKSLEKINTGMILSIIKEKGPIETRALEEEVMKNKVCSKATLFRKLSELREEGYVAKEEKEGKSYYSISESQETKEESQENLAESQAQEQSQN